MNARFVVGLAAALVVGSAGLYAASLLGRQDGPLYISQAHVDPITLTEQLEPYLNQGPQKCNLDTGVVEFEYSDTDKKRVLKSVSPYNPVGHFFGSKSAVNGDSEMKVKLTFDPKKPSFKIKSENARNENPDTFIDGVLDWPGYSADVRAIELTALVEDSALVRILEGTKKVEGTDKKLCGPTYNFSF